MELSVKDLALIKKENKAKVFSFNREEVIENTKKNPEWIHFGAGNIFRIFPAALCQNLLNKGLMNTGIVVAEGFDEEIVDRIYDKYDNLTLAITLKADGSVDKEVIGSVCEALVVDRARDSWKRLEEVFTSKSLKMVSFTITEKGYATKNNSGNLLPGYEEDFKKDIKEGKMLLSKLVYLLYLRYQNGKAPLAFVSMDNCSHNGEKLRDAILLISKAYVDNGSLDASFVSYVKDEAKVSFPWSMIDKITPRPDSSVFETLKKEGWENMDPIITAKHTYIAPYVNAEETQYLVIEDRFPNGRPKLEESGVYFTDRETVNKTERMKVTTCLNPLHTALALSGCILSYTKINEEMKDEDLVKMIKRLGYIEGLPVVTDPKIINPKKFIDEVIDIRLPNPFMPDTPQRIATDSSQKLSIRFGETIKAYLEKDPEEIKKLRVVPLVFALFMRYLLAIDDSGRPFELSPDPMKDELREDLRGITVGKPLTEEEEKNIHALLSSEKIFGIDITKTALYEKALSYFKMMISSFGGTRKAIEKAIED